MRSGRTDLPFHEALPQLLAEREVSLRQVARAADVDHAHLVRLVKERRSPSADLSERLAEALAVSPDYFVEYREALAIAAVKTDPALRDRIYQRTAAGNKARQERDIR
jgi:transcriptional regulator with XRE-family HTH domain